jgi:hypothetical protein
MNIKVKRTALIKSLEKALKTRMDKKAAYEKASEAYATEVKAFEATILEAVLAGKIKISNIHISNWEYGHSSVREATIAFPIDIKKFKRPQAPDYPQRFSDTQITEIQNAIAILLLSEEDFVNASTYKSVSQYIA